MVHVVICTKEYRAPFETVAAVIFKRGEVYQAEDHGVEIRVWRNNTCFLKFSPRRFGKFFRIFC